MKAQVLELRPTQFALGMREVAHKVAKIRKMSAKEVEEHLALHPVPVVEATGGELHLIDHHHLVRACWELGIPQVKVDKKADLSHLEGSHFWKEMTGSGWVYLFDQFGKGPHPAEFLPADIRGLADDPFRSLAWELRERHGFDKSERPFCEFSWANFLRGHFDGHPERLGFEDALKRALELSRRPEAKKLPGYKG